MEYVASWALPMILKHQEFFLFSPLKATVCLASLCSKKCTKIYHSVLGREDKRSLVARFGTWNECVPRIVMIFFFLVFLGPKRSPCIMQELEQAPFSYDPAGYLVWVVFLSQVNQSASERYACLRLNFALRCLNSFSLLKVERSFLFSCALSRSGRKVINELK